MGNYTENCQTISIVIRYDSFNNHKLIGTETDSLCCICYYWACWL